MNVDEKIKRKKGFDRLLLIVSAIVASILLFYFLLLLEKVIVEDAWRHYIIACIIYIVVFLYGVKKQIGLSRVANFTSIVLVLFLIIFPIFIGYLIFHYQILPLPLKGRFYIYSIFVTAILATAIICLDQCLKFIERKKRKNTGL